MKKVNFSLIFLLFNIYIYAQQAYTLDSCIALALKHNVEIKNGLLSIDMAKQTKNEAFTKYFPKITGTFIGFQAKMEGSLQTSLDITLDDYIVPSNTMTVDYSFIKKGFSTGISAIQPVFVGGQIFYGNKLANIGYKVEKLQLCLSQNEIKRKVEDYFWQIVSLEEKLKTVNTLSSQLNNIYKDAEISVKAGVINNNEFLKVQLKQQEMLSAKIKIENGIRMTKSALRQYIGIQERDFTILHDSLSFLPDSPQNYYVNPEEAVSKRIETQLLSYQKEAGKLQTKIEIGKHLPTVGIGAAYTYSLMTDFHNKLGFVFGTISVPITDWWGGAYAIKKQKLQEKIYENDYQNGIEMLELQTEQAWNELNEAYMQLQVAQLGIKQAEDYLKICSDCYASGTISLSNLLEAQSMLQQNQNQFLDAYIIFFQKRTYYIQLTGK